MPTLDHPRRKTVGVKPLNPQIKAEMIRDLRRAGYTERSIALLTGLSQPRVSQVCAAMT